MDINFNVSPKDREMIVEVVERAIRLARDAGWNYDRMDAEMDVTACHLNGCKLDLPKLLRADDFTFAHDVFGIRRHLNRTTGALLDCFSPRCEA